MSKGWTGESLVEQVEHGKNQTSFLLSDISLVHLMTCSQTAEDPESHLQWPLTIEPVLSTGLQEDWWAPLFRTQRSSTLKSAGSQAMDHRRCTCSLAQIPCYILIQFSLAHEKYHPSSSRELPPQLTWNSPCRSPPGSTVDGSPPSKRCRSSFRPWWPSSADPTSERADARSCRSGPWTSEREVWEGSGRPGAGCFGG